MKLHETDYFLLITSIAAVVCAVYWPSLSLPFIQDDWSLLNAFRTQDTLSMLKLIFAYENALFVRPLPNLYLWLMYELWGVDPTPFHIVALIVHVLNSCLVAFVLNLLTRNRLISYLTALVYAAAIAIHLEPLAWIVGIYDVGAAFFFLTSLWSFLRDRPILSAILYFVGCLFKESLFTVSILLISYSLVMNIATSLKEKRKTIRVDWKQIVPLGIATILVLSLRLSGEVSPFDLPATHPYAIKLLGIHVIRNGLVYLGWMFQSFVPLWQARAYTDQFYKVAIVVALFIGGLSAFCLLQRKSLSRQILFLLMWLLFALLPVLFLPNHSFRYYATYALPAFAGLFLFTIRELFLRLHVRNSVIVLVLMGIGSLAVLGSIFQGNRIYREGLNQNTFLDGTGLLIRRAAFVDIVYDGLKQHLPGIPSNAVIIIENADIWSFDKDSGPQVWYNDSTVHIYARSDLKYGEDGQPYVANPVQNQEEHFVGSDHGNIRLDPSKLFIFEVSNGKLKKIVFDR